MSESWYFVLGSEPQGPHTQRELQDLLCAGTLTLQTLLWREGMSDWTPVSEHPWLATTGTAPGMPPIPPPKTSAKLAPPKGAEPPRSSAPVSVANRPSFRPAPPSHPTPLIAAAIGVALAAGLGIGWMAHAMLVQPRPQQGIVAQTPAVKGPSKTVKEITPAVPRASAPSTPAAPPAVTSQETVVASAPVASAPSVPNAPSAPTEFSPAPPENPAPAAGTSAAVPAATPSPASTPSATPPVTPTGSQSPSTSQTGSPITETLYQEIDVQRAPKFAVLGVVTAQSLRYQMLSELRVGQQDAKGNRTVAQTVIDTRLVAADMLSQPTIEPALAKIKGWQFSYTLSKGGEVLSMKAGPADAPVAAKVEPMGGKGFLVASVMDEAGWKELAQISFYAPDEQASGNKRELRQMTHDFGPLGSWVGETSFQRKGTQQGLLRIDYTHKLAYRPPAKNAVGDLPFAVKGAELRPDIAGGTIWYDVKAKRVKQAEDRFRVKGEIATDLAGVQLEEEQVIAVRIGEESPWQK